MTAPVRPSAPALPAGLSHRPMRLDDAARWADLLTAAEAVDRIDEHYDIEDCAEELSDPEVDLDRQTCLVLDGDVAVAYQVLHHRTGGADAPRLIVEATVRPEHRGRGIGTALLAAAMTTADGLRARLTMVAPETNPGAVALATDAAMVPVRWWSQLTMDLDGPVPPVPAPAGYTVAPLGPDFDAARWDEPLRLAHNAAFADHWGAVPDTPEGWVHWRTGSRAFRAACSAVATTPDGAVAGYVLGFEWEADTARTGRRDLYIGVVGTAAEHRGRGLAGALLGQVLLAARDLGYRSSSLSVDAQNPTGALGVYERAGYRLHRRTVSYARPRP